MVAILFLLISYVSLGFAVPTTVTFPQIRNTIFADEKFDGEIFHNIDLYEEEIIDPQNYRLPTTTKPLNYKLLIGVVFEPDRFISGTVEIYLKATQNNVNTITIHSEDLEIQQQDVILTLDDVNIPITWSTEKEYDFLHVRLETGTLNYNPNVDNIYKLEIKFEAPMRTDMYGIYESWYYNDNELKWMATTQFQGTSARRAFPCYDEPSFKAYFDITIRRPRAYSSWSCTKLNTTNEVPGLNMFQDDVFTRTPYMSTYLLALIVAEYDSKELTDDDGELLYEVIARPEAMRSDQGDYAFYVGQELLNEMNRLTDYNFYTQSENLKMTQAAIPDFGAGAMENWGLLTYREAYLMYDEQHTDSLFKQRIAYILSHEIAHMWFGNLVTCDWWDVLWLNEGFARYYQYYLTDLVETDMGFDTRFVVEQVHTALLSDSTTQSHPLTHSDVGSPRAVSAMFSTVTYNKGAAVIRMTEYLLGTEVHRIGLSNYLKDREFDTALPIHLFQALQDQAVESDAISEYGPDFSVIDYYKTWTEQSGHPVLFVQVNHQTGDMTITQRRFDVNYGYSSIGAKWIVPITFTTASNTNFYNTKPTHILRNTVSVINRNSVGDEWVIFNNQQIGFYRVNYDDYTWGLITLALRGDARNIIHEHNKAQIVNDVFQFARSGIMTYTRAFNILSFLKYETQYAPWVSAMTGFNWLTNRYAGSDFQQTLESMIIDWAETVMAKVGYSPRDEEFMDSYLRYQLAPWMCRLNVRACRDAAVEQFQTLLAPTPGEVAVDNRIWVYCNALREGGADEFNILWNRFNTIPVYTEKILLLQTLGCTKDVTSLHTLLDAIIEDNHIIRRQDYNTAWSSAVSGNEENTQIVFDYIKANLDNVTEGYGEAYTPLSYITSRLRTEQQIVEFETWALTVRNQLGDEYERIVRAAGNVRNSLAWASANLPDIDNYITNGDDQIQMSTPSTTTEVEIVTEPLMEIENPETPELPDSAATNLLSMFLLIGALLINL